MRLVSLCPSLTELLHDLGAAGAVVGRTKFCVHPAPWVLGIEAVGGTKNPRLDRIIALAPDLVLMNEEENRADDAQALREAGVAVHSSMPRTVTDTAQMVRSIAHAIGRVAEGERIATDIERRAQRVAQRAASLAEVSYAYLIWRDPWMTVNHDTFISAMLALAGGRNAFGAAGDRLPRSPSTNCAQQVPTSSSCQSEPFLRREARGELCALTGGRGAIRPGRRELLSWHGSRTPAGIYAESLLAAVRSARRCRGSRGGPCRTRMAPRGW
jgi:hypothetical protein